jgi:Restriction endonuclease
MNTGIPYELVIQAMFQEILNKGGGRTIKVRHNVVVKGRTTKHQIDLMWRFSVGGIKYTTIVQATDWTSKVKKSAVLAFRGVLDDLPGQPRGVMITRTGFQAGAKALAERHGIKLYLLKQITPHLQMVVGDYAIMSLDLPANLIRTTLYHPVLRRCQFFTNVPIARGPSQFNMHRDRTYLVDDVGRSIGTLHDIMTSCVTEMNDKKTLSAVFDRKFDQPTFLELKRSKRRHPRHSAPS